MNRKERKNQQGLPQHFLLLLKILHHINTTSYNNEFSKEREPLFGLAYTPG